MSLNLDWNRLRRVHKDLEEHGDLSAETDITFLFVLTNGQGKKSVVKFKDFMKFLWSVEENANFTVSTLVVQDKEGRVLYRHKQRTNGDEEIPDGGHTGVITHWSAYTPHEKDIYLRILIAQIQGYER